VAFNEQFSDSSLSNWIKDTGYSYPGGPPNWGTGEIQEYSTSSEFLSASSGRLLIRPKKGSDGVWRSARIETQQKFTPQAGKTFRVEARLRLGSASASQQAGIWPAFWMLGGAYRGNYQNWPAVGEVDIMESINGRSEAFNVVHCSTCNEPNGIGTSSSMSRGTWHVLRFEIKRNSNTSRWQTETLTWYLDGRVTFRLTGAQIGSQSWPALAYSDRFVLLNVAVGGSFPNAVFGGATPTPNTITNGVGTEMEVDYVKVGHVEDGILW